MVARLLTFVIAAAGSALLLTACGNPPTPTEQTQTVRAGAATTAMPSQRVEQRARGPAGQPGPVTVIVPNYPAHPGTPTVRGPFRLLPFGYFDPPGSTPRPGVQCEPPTVDPADTNVIRSSAVYATIGYIPAKFAYREPMASLVCAAEVREIKWSFPGSPGGSLDISRGISQFPFDVRMPPDDSWFTVESGDVDGVPAVFAKNKPGQHGTQTMYLADGNITTIIDASLDDYADLIQIARSLRR